MERQITADQVLAVLWQAMATYGVPAYLRSDSGSEFIADKVQQWFRMHQIKTLYIDPGSPWQNPSSRASTVVSATSASSGRCYLISTKRE